MRFRAIIVGGAALVLTGCAADPHPRFEARSVGGKALLRPEIPAARRAVLDANCDAAYAAFVAEPNEENTIWFGRRLAYRGEFRRAIEVYTSGLERFPQSYRLLRHRGHRYITTREFDRAISDLTRAAGMAERSPDAMEPDGDPNPSGVPRSSDRSNIYYHLGLACYLQGRYGEAERWFSERGALALRNDDMVVSESHWRVLSLVRLGRDGEARRVLEGVRAEMDVVENGNYQRLCLFYKGVLSAAEVLGEGPLDASVAYGVAAWMEARGEREAGRRLKERIVAETNWGAFGHIAAEADLARE